MKVVPEPPLSEPIRSPQCVSARPAGNQPKWQSGPDDGAVGFLKREAETKQIDADGQVQVAEFQVRDEDDAHLHWVDGRGGCLQNWTAYWLVSWL
jgi:hypothetical protein